MKTEHFERVCRQVDELAEIAAEIAPRGKSILDKQQLRTNIYERVVADLIARGFKSE